MPERAQTDQHHHQLRESAPSFGVLDHPLVQRAYSEYSQLVQDFPSLYTPSGVRTVQRPLPLRATACLPVVLAEVFGMQDQTVIENTCLAQLFMNHYAHLVDFATDEAFAGSPLIFHVSSLVLAKAIVIYGGLAHAGGRFWQHWERYGIEASTSERFLWCHRHSMLPYGNTDLSHMSGKSALLKSTAALYASVLDDWAPLEAVETGLQCTFLAVQLVDDLMDWESDLTAGIYTYPLWLAYSQANTLDPVSLATTFLRNNIRRASTALTDALDQFRFLHGTALVGLIDSLQLSLTQVLEELHDRSRTALELPGEYDIRKYIRTIIDPRLAH